MERKEEKEKMKHIEDMNWKEFTIYWWAITIALLAASVVALWWLS